jgi:hypothetical protein
MIYDTIIDEQNSVDETNEGTFPGVTSLLSRDYVH